MTFLMILLALAVTIAIFATTSAGREIAKRIGFRDHVSGAATSEDVAYLLSACDGDRAALKERVEAERLRYPDLTEAEHYRRAIRKVFAERES
jgi:hypothetical protein